MPAPFVLQPTLDRTGGNLHGFLPGTDFDTVDQPLRTRAESFPQLDDVSPSQRMADALVAMAADTVTTTNGDSGTVDIFVDASLAAPTRGEAGVTTASGTRLGPLTLEETLCDGAIRTITVDAGRPVRYSDRTTTVPAAIRAFVRNRDLGQCRITGCGSRHRLPIHHITERHRGGSNDPDNLITLCWYHHRVAIHRMGLQLTRQPHIPGWTLTTACRDPRKPGG